MNNKKIIVIASNNSHKIKEFKEILTEYDIITLNDINYNDEIEENGKSNQENALIKADDSGLCVDSLKGAPGVYSARYAGVHGDEQANRDKLLKELEGKERTAYFVCAIAIVYPNGDKKTVIGKTFGEITTKEIGSKEFGYDCIFYSNDLNKTFGEASKEEKNSVSHRGRAIKKIIENGLL